MAQSGIISEFEIKETVNTALYNERFFKKIVWHSLDQTFFLFNYVFLNGLIKQEILISTVYLQKLSSTLMVRVWKNFCRF